MTKRITESNAESIRALLDLLTESAEAEVVEAAEEASEEEEVNEAAEHDAGSEQESKGEKYESDASMPGKAAAKVRYTPARQSDNPMVEMDLHKSFLEYLKEAEAKEADEAASDDEDKSED